MRPTVHLRSETRSQERRAAISPAGAEELLQKGFTVVVEESRSRVFPIGDYAAVGCGISPAGNWISAGGERFVLGLKELPESPAALRHRHIMFGHAFKQQPSAEKLLRRFQRGGGILYDIEYLTDDSGHRLAAFGYWAGYAGAAVTLMAWATAKVGADLPDLASSHLGRIDLQRAVEQSLQLVEDRPKVIIVGMGRTGSGARELCANFDLDITGYDIAETSGGGPFPEILEHDIFLNCVLASESTPTFLDLAGVNASRRLRTVGDIACDPGSPFNPVPIYDHVTSFAQPAIRVGDDPPLDVIAIDNLPSLLPAESSLDFSRQLLPQLEKLGQEDSAVWNRARHEFERHMRTI